MAAATVASPAVEPVKPHHDVKLFNRWSFNDIQDFIVPGTASSQSTLNLTKPLVTLVVSSSKTELPTTVPLPSIGQGGKELPQLVFPNKALREKRNTGIGYDLDLRHVSKSEIPNSSHNWNL
ncbi:hypothetical protein M0R45_000091 [Rubus argutus]|uniref:Uncharacterized protein n=1 Tax=Rubus argutus TaxID=59490 RepID=A0AAW1VMS0_RUBAR